MRTFPRRSSTQLRLSGSATCRCAHRHEAAARQQPLAKTRTTLREAGHETEHVGDHDLSAAPDATVLQHARDHDLVLVSADIDFGTLLARTGADRPSVILIRRSSARRASELATLLLSNLDAITDDLESGAVVVITDTDLRVRTLPIPPGPRSG